MMHLHQIIFKKVELPLLIDSACGIVTEFQPKRGGFSLTLTDQ